jgi:hypothetical protein
VKSNTFFLLAYALLATATFGAEPSLPTGNIIQHYDWASKARNPKERLKRFELFWAEHKPVGKVYDDDAHHIYTRKAAYALARLYAGAALPNKCAQIIDWLESDDRIR